MAGGTQCTVPVEKRWALVMWVTANSPSALGRGEELGDPTQPTYPRQAAPGSQQWGTPITKPELAQLLGVYASV